VDVARFAYAEALAKDKEALRGALQTWIAFWRDLLLRTAGASAPLVNVDREDQIETLASQISTEKARAMISRLEYTLELLDRNVNSRLALDVVMLDLPAFLR
jgi:DNA polymerase-3 subunit delta'